MRRIAVVLLSGGLDSTTVAAYAREQGYELMALTFNYGQKHVREIECARTVARLLGIRHEVVEISFLKQLAWYSALTRPESFEVPRHKDSQEITVDIPITYVPLRNTLFISLGAAFLESQALYAIETQHADPDQVEASLFIAVNAVDYSGYPDCRPRYFEQMSRTLLEGSKLGTTYRRPIVIQTPIMRKSKAEIVKIALELKAPIEHTWSCYEGEKVPCGECDSCLLRAKGFAEAGISDPLLARLKKDGKTSPGK
ncbi:MAG: 7-cyano-7-deazaguanine synthase QueC [Chloroflexi bacterium]|nr:7-cyano-7-deazaguanine synthase QueC [Chloroflexota bacterium]